MASSLIVIAHNIRSAHNIGALLRTADGLGVDMLYFTGYSPYPIHPKDIRLPHIARKADSQIHKTALGAEKTVKWDHIPEASTLLASLRTNDYVLAGLEQAPGSSLLTEFQPPDKLALLLGSEVTGIDNDLIKLMDVILEIPMEGKKESFNVVEAATMAMYHCKYGIVN
jgi:23S rRNA (guanosine2251-2'-O)-methyltransferase